MNVKVHYATAAHIKYAEAICELIQTAAKARGTGIAKREPEYVRTKLNNENAVIALDGDKLAGFCYIEVWQNKEYLANSGLVVHPDYRNIGLAKQIKKKIFKLSQEKFPGVKIFGITTSLAVMKINYELGYKPVTFSELTTDESFWKGCQSCPNHDILMRNDHKNCLCTGMLLDSKSNNFVAKSKRLIKEKFQKISSLKTKGKIDK